ncbi:MAG: hypothetical protein IJA78_03070 [Clostridia bacterium]|nr:hypothetical protein [Clostridia bacterium]
MCDVCGGALCAPLCPCRPALPRCAVCGAALRAQDDALERDGALICSTCMENLSVPSLLALTARRGVRDFLRHELGFVPHA